MRRLGAVGVALLLALGACGGSKAPPPSAPQVTLSSDGPLTPAIVGASLLRRVPGFSEAVLQPLADVTLFEDKDPRGPCGAKVPGLKLTDALGSSWTAQTIRGGAQIVVRRPAGEARRYLTSRLNDISPKCAPYTAKSAQGVTQTVKYEAAVRIARDADQSLATVSAVRIGSEVRAMTEIEVRRGDVLSRAVVFSNAPMDNRIVRGIGNLMFKALQRLA